MKNISNETITSVLHKKGGNLSQAAKALKISRTTLYNWIDKDDELKDVVEEIQESLIDFTESELMRKIKGFYYLEVTKEPDKDGNLVTVKEVRKYMPPDTTAIIFFLKTRGKKRGYVESDHIDITSNGKMMEMPKPIIIRSVNDLEKEEMLAQING